jgi:hypothetical protein
MNRLAVCLKRSANTSEWNSRNKLKPRRMMDLGEIGWAGEDWKGLAQDGDKWRALVNVVMNLRVP